MIFICGEIKDLVSESDKHCAYLEDPDDVDLNGEFDGISEDEVEKCTYALRFFVLLTYTYDCQAGNAVTQLSRNFAASSLTFGRKLTKGHLKSSASFMQR